MGGFWAYEPAFLGGVTVASGYVDGDNRVDIVTGAAYGGGPHVRTFLSRHGERMSNIWPYAREFTGGVNVAAHGWIDPPPEGIVDPLEVFDANDGLLLREEVTEHEVAGFSVDLRAQVYAASSTRMNGTSPTPAARSTSRATTRTACNSTGTRTPPACRRSS
jgi:hypothetical protein